MHLPAFCQVLSGFSEDADSRAETVSPMVMTSYNTVDGIPVTCNAFLLDTLLRGQWGYDGVVISDLYSINGIVGAGVASDLREAAVMALTAGCDIDLGGSAYRRLAQAVRDGDVDEALVDRAVARVLRLKFALGLFEQPYVDEIPAETSQEVLAGAVALAEEVAQEGIVLLENRDGVLPLSFPTPCLRPGIRVSGAERLWHPCFWETRILQGACPCQFRVMPASFLFTISRAA